MLPEGTSGSRPRETEKTPARPERGTRRAFRGAVARVRVLATSGVLGTSVVVYFRHAPFPPPKSSLPSPVRRSDPRRHHRSRRAVSARGAAEWDTLRCARAVDRLPAAVGQGGEHDPSAVVRDLSGEASARRARADHRRERVARRGTVASEDRISARPLRPRGGWLAATRPSRPAFRRRDHRAPRTGEGDRPMDGADVPHVPARPAGRAPRARSRRAERHPARVWLEASADAEGRTADRREMAAVRVDGELVSLAIAGERRR